MVELASYSLYGPDLKETPLPMPVAKPSDSFDIDNGLTVVSGDIDTQKIFRGMLYRGTAVSYFIVEKWWAPQSLGYDLETLPLTDLSDIWVGDLVQFKIFFMGKNLNTSPEISIEYITAMSDPFGGRDRFTLSCMIFDGKGQFSMPAAGQWHVNVYTRQEVTADNDLKHLFKHYTALFSSSITFKVNP